MFEPDRLIVSYANNPAYRWTCENFMFLDILDTPVLVSRMKCNISELLEAFRRCSVMEWFQDRFGVIARPARLAASSGGAATPR